MLAKKKTQKAGRVLAEPQQVAEVLSLVTGKLGKGLKALDFETAKYWAGHASDRELNKTVTNLAGVLLRASVVVDEKLADWVKFYHEVFDINLARVEIELPAEREGFNWLIVVAKGLTNNQVFDLCLKRFRVWRYYDDLNKAITINDREPAETYAVRVRNRVSADEENRNRSANATAQAGIKGITNLERMILELWYHWKTSNHLDTETGTINSGSRYAGDTVPGSRWRDDGFGVYYVIPVHSFDDWRVREVSL